MSVRLPLVLFSFSSTVADGPVRNEDERLTATGRGPPPWFSVVPLPSLVLNLGDGLGATKGYTKLKWKKFQLEISKNKLKFTLAMMLLDVKLLSSETDFRGLGVGTVLATLTSSLRWLKGPRMIYTPTRMRKITTTTRNHYLIIILRVKNKWLLHGDFSLANGLDLKVFSRPWRWFQSSID